MSNAATQEGLSSALASMSLAADATEAQSSRCRLLELPAELRNRIYEYALLSNNFINILDSKSVLPGILGTCRQTREEGLEMYLSRNEFLARIRRGKSYDQLLQWLEQAGPDNISKIRTLSIAVEDVLTEIYNERQRRYVIVLSAYLQDVSKYLRTDQVSWPSLVAIEVTERSYQARSYATHQAIVHHAIVPEISKTLALLRFSHDPVDPIQQLKDAGLRVSAVQQYHVERFVATWTANLERFES